MARSAFDTLRKSPPSSKLARESSDPSSPSNPTSSSGPSSTTAFLTRNTSAGNSSHSSQNSSHNSSHTSNNGAALAELATAVSTLQQHVVKMDQKMMDEFAGLRAYIDRVSNSQESLVAFLQQQSRKESRETRDFRRESTFHRESSLGADLAIDENNMMVVDPPRPRLSFVVPVIRTPGNEAPAELLARDAAAKKIQRWWRWMMMERCFSGHRRALHATGKFVRQVTNMEHWQDVVSSRTEKLLSKQKTEEEEEEEEEEDGEAVEGSTHDNSVEGGGGGSGDGQQTAGKNSSQASKTKNERRTSARRAGWQTGQTFEMTATIPFNDNDRWVRGVGCGGGGGGW
jgi:hypothetical protein